MDPEELAIRFTYHPPTPEQVPLYAETRVRAKELAEYIDTTAPDGREKSLALTHLDEVVFWTNAAIARRS
jgi:hypothetical protein